MFRRILFTLLACIIMAFPAACSFTRPTPIPEANMPNPASVYCKENGGKLELRQDASGGVAGVCIFPDGSECDEWAYIRGECAPGSPNPTQWGSPVPTQLPAETPLPASIDIPTAMPFDPADYAGWWTYTHPVYGFSLQLPLDWVVDETSANDALLNGHLLMIHEQNSPSGLLIRMTFRSTGQDEILLWPTGVGAGQLIEQGTLDIADQPARRVYFVCPTGQVQSIYYHGQDGPNIQLSDSEFAFILTFTGHYCEEGFSLEGKIQRIGEMVIASLTMP